MKAASSSTTRPSPAPRSATPTDCFGRSKRSFARTPEVSSYSRRTGLQLGGGLTEADEGDFFIRLKSGNRRNIEEVMSEIGDKVQAQVPGLQIETAQLMEDLIGDLTAVPEPIEVKLFSDDPTQLAHAAQKVADGIGGIRGVVEVNNGLRVSGDAIAINVDRGAASLEGLDPATVAQQVSAQVEGDVATHILSGEQTIDVRVRAPQDLRRRADLLAALPLRSPDGRATTLGSIGKISIEAGQRQLTREDLAPFIAVTARLEGKDLGTGMRDVQAKVQSLSLPPSIRVEYGGLYSQQKQSFRDLTTVFVAALLLSALLLTLLFEKLGIHDGGDFDRSHVHVGGLLRLMANRDRARHLGADGAHHGCRNADRAVDLLPGRASNRRKPIEAKSLLRAGEARLRPILMSALIAIPTPSLPLALGFSRGSGLQRPLATAIIFGLSLGAFVYSDAIAGTGASFHGHYPTARQARFGAS